MEDQAERLESQVSSLAREKGVLARELARCQRQLAHARDDGAVAHGNLQWVLENGVAKDVDVVLSSLAETNFAGHFRLGELDYDNFRQLCRRPGPGGTSSDSWG
ncbi:unnamed protein product [Lactuca saligna]|uniref:Uncharacterized protein n=1 Tax=Lactuca saligna TaxID=75948 RepID=A0AA36DX65_LACSI|nr:unnamed protein product [Lactuca saligna]